MADLFQHKESGEFLEANQVLPLTAEAVAVWCGGVSVIEHDAFDHNLTYAGINVPTAEGMKRAQECSWILRGPEGNFVIVGDEEFKEKFESVK